MITILSPSKTQDYSDTQLKIAKKQHFTTPTFIDDTSVLAGKLKEKSPDQIMKLMSVSENLATLNYERFQQFALPFNQENARQAILAFKGDVYTDIDIENYTKKEFEFAQEHLRIISGLYGLLRPLDLIQPYRLEMKIKLKNPKGKDLYEFWNGKITQTLNEILGNHKQKTLVNLASNEYFKVINRKNLAARIITPVFKEFKNGDYKVIALFAKRARGAMANYIIKSRIDNPEKLKSFAENRYEFSEKLSSENEWVFIR